jgi:hypothetical protein
VNQQAQFLKRALETSELASKELYLRLLTADAIISELQSVACAFAWDAARDGLDIAGVNFAAALEALKAERAAEKAKQPAKDERRIIT